MENEPVKKKPFGNPKTLIIIMVIAIFIALLGIGIIFVIFYQQVSNPPVISRSTSKKIDEGDLKIINNYQFYGQPIDSQSVGRPDPFQPY